MRKNFTSEQMLYTVRQAESGTLGVGSVSQGGITEQTFYKWFDFNAMSVVCATDRAFQCAALYA